MSEVSKNKESGKRKHTNSGALAAAAVPVVVTMRHDDEEEEPSAKMQAELVEGRTDDPTLDPSRWNTEDDVKFLSKPRLLPGRGRGVQVYAGKFGKLVSISDFYRRGRTEEWSADFKKQITLTKDEFDALIGCSKDLIDDYEDLSERYDNEVSTFRIQKGSGLKGASSLMTYNAKQKRSYR